MSVSWNRVTARDSDGRPITCIDSVSRGSVSVDGDNFGVGLHTVTCTVTNAGGVTGSGSFTFNVAGTVGRICCFEARQNSTFKS